MEKSQGRVPLSHCTLSMCVHCVVQQHLWCVYTDTQSAVVWIEKMVESLPHINM